MSCLTEEACERGKKREGVREIQVSVYFFQNLFLLYSHLISDIVLSFENDVVTTGVPLFAKQPCLKVSKYDACTGL